MNDINVVLLTIAIVTYLMGMGLYLWAYFGIKPKRR